MGTLKEIITKIPSAAAFIEGLRKAIEEGVAFLRKLAAASSSPEEAAELVALADKFQRLLDGTALPAEAAAALAELQEAISTFSAPVVHDPEVDLQ